MSTEHKPITVSGWKKAALHYPLCPSGVRVGIRIPNLAALIEAGDIPQHLLDVALGVATGDEVKPSVELIKQSREFTDKLVMLMVVEPKLTEADLADVPYEDKEFLVSIGTRQRDIDAEGEHIAGLSSSERFRRFRGLGEFDPALEGA
jgi:hypothetical protein